MGVTAQWQAQPAARGRVFAGHSADGDVHAAQHVGQLIGALRRPHPSQSMLFPQPFRYHELSHTLIRYLDSMVFYQFFCRQGWTEISVFSNKISNTLFLSSSLS
ncbi:MAG: hypothetical protein LLG42_10550 [Chloroflexi bacterium]|nr:hypothetical protein [Chloroflexota bacterium]